MDDEARRQHRFIRYADERLLASEASRMAAFLLNRWLKQEFSVTKYRKLGRQTLQHTTESSSREITLRFEDLADHIQANRGLKPEELSLPRVECDWLDFSIPIGKPDGPIANEDFSEFLKFALDLPFGPQFPLQPCIDREGAMFSTFQTPIQENIVTLHRRLVADSHLTTSLSNPWRNDLRMLINESISLIDITLHQLYFMAQYRGREQGWRFEPDRWARATASASRTSSPGSGRSPATHWRPRPSYLISTGCARSGITSITSIPHVWPTRWKT